MYGVPSIAVDKRLPVEKLADSKDKGLGFDFSAISDFVKTAATTGLNIYQNQMQLKQIKAMSSPPMYGPNQYVQLPMSQALGPVQPTFGGQYVAPPQQTGMSTGTMLAIGAFVLGGIAIVAFRK